MSVGTIHTIHNWGVGSRWEEWPAALLANALERQVVAWLLSQQLCALVAHVTEASQLQTTEPLHPFQRVQQLTAALGRAAHTQVHSYRCCGCVAQKIDCSNRLCR